MEEKLKEFDLIRFTVHDLHGISRHQIRPVKHALRALKGMGPSMTGGAMMLQGPLGEVNVQDSVMEICPNFGSSAMTPFKETLHALPWAGGKHRMGEIFCETNWVQRDGTLKPHPSPRYLARKQYEELQQMGFTFKAGLEMEFLAQKADSGELLFSHEEYMTSFVTAPYEELLGDVALQLADAGVPIETLHLEHAPGQVEIVTAPIDGIEGADQFMLSKQAIKEIFAQNGLTATFMTKPYVHSGTSGAHISHSLWTADGKSAFHDVTQPHRMSATMRHWVAGLMKHAKEMTALSCPVVNDYRRFFQPFAPGPVTWDIDSRDCLFRIKNWTAGSTLVENRLPAAAHNAYLSLAAMLAAGIDGIKHELELSPPGDSHEHEKLQRTLGEALDDLDKSTFMREALDTNFIDWFISDKRQVEMNDKIPHHANLIVDDESQYKVERDEYFYHI